MSTLILYYLKKYAKKYPRFLRGNDNPKYRTIKKDPSYS